MVFLRDVLRDVKNDGYDEKYGNTKIVGITADLSKVQKDFIFIAICGRHFDGHCVVKQAAELGAACVVCDKLCGETKQGVIKIKVENTRKALAEICSNFYGRPAEKLIIIGITGTNGKTTTSYMLNHILTENGIKSGVIGTVEMFANLSEREKISEKTGYTTPEPAVLYPLLKKMADGGCTHVIMEVSSQALDQNRVHGINFEIGIFTNLTVDHLDYHGTMSEYKSAKLKLFFLSKYCLANCDSDYAKDFIDYNGNVKTYSINQKADYYAENILTTSTGNSYKIVTKKEEATVFQEISGRFNISNSLAAISAAEILGIPLKKAANSMKTFLGVPGRMERIETGNNIRVIIDFAHTPDGLKNLLQAIRLSTAKRIIVVFGCGGDRDKSKRPQMGKIAVSYADFAVITSDNPRTEKPEDIINDIISELNKTNYITVCDRRNAIAYALKMAKDGDTVLLAGKGHEKYQEINGEKLPFDERTEVKKYYGEG